MAPDPPSFGAGCSAGPSRQGRWEPADGRLPSSARSRAHVSLLLWNFS